MKNKKTFKKISLSTFSLLFAASLLIFGETKSASSLAGVTPIAGNYFTADYDSKKEAWDNADHVNEEICEEGFTVLKNEDNTLPLPKGSKISVFGKSSQEMLYGLSSNYVHLRVVDAPMVTMSETLQDAGFIVNPTLVNFYEDSAASGPGRGTQPTNGATVKGFNTGETPIAKYTAAVEASYESYNDAAIIVLSRSSGEGWDLPKTMVDNSGNLINGARAKDDHYLQLDQNESDLMKYVGNNFNKVIVIFNTPTTFETGFLDDPGHYGYHENLKAAIWIGYSGRTGLKALGKILCGDVNPSGRTVDTWARDYKNDPTWGNFGVFTISDGGVYVMYKEGIYIGYRYYETRGYTEGDKAYDSFIGGTNSVRGTSTRDWNSWYESAVCYPLGHGLSYTTFKEEIVDTNIPANSNIDGDSVVTLSVKVTNTGSLPGKRTSLIFVTAPYYDGGIEKPYVTFAGFGKTKLLQPNEEEILNISIKVRELASYDYSDANNNGFKGYELEAGKYEFKLMNDAHTLIDKVDYNVLTNIKIETSDTTGYKIENQFDDVSNFMTDSTTVGGLGEKYLSRSDFAGTWPKDATTVKLTTALRNEYKEYSSGNVPDDSTKKYYVSSADIKFGDDTGSIKLADLLGLDYDDPLWDDFLDQLSESSMTYLVAEGSYRSGKDIPKLGITRVINAGQPAGYMSLFSGMGGAQYAFFSSDTVTASTYNEELAYKKGLAIGNEALFGTGQGKSRFPGWYAPAADTHRSPFGGRCADYFSEEGVIAGKLASKIIEGATEKGVFTFFKHFALNEQENHRVQLTTWANEQSMREIYFKPFELAVKEGHTLAIMSALNRVGPIWSGGHYGLLQEVLRNEWGFNGCVVTDSYIKGFSLLDQMIKNGGDLALGSASSEISKLGSASKGTMTPTTYVTLRESVHHILYPMANSMAINTGYAVPPQMIDEYTGCMLPLALVNTEYSENLGTARINPDAFPEGSEVPSDKDIEYSLKEGSTLPSGLSLSTSGILSGTPVEEVSGLNFTVQARYQTCVREATFSITVSNINGSIVYTPIEGTKTLFINEECLGYSVGTARIEKKGATEEELANLPTIEYSLEGGSYLPLGLTLNSDGTITGTPTRECKDYEFSVIASALGFKEVKMTFKLEVIHKVNLQARSLSDAKLNTPYLEKIVDSVPNSGYTYSIKTGSSLPAGLTLTKAGYITGSPKTTVKDHTFVVVVEGEFIEYKEITYSLTVGIKYNRVEAPKAHVNKDYYLDVAQAQGASDIVYRVADGVMLPLDITLSEDGKLSGKFRQSGIVTLTIIAYSPSLGTSDSIRISIYVSDK